MGKSTKFAAHKSHFPKTKFSKYYFQRNMRVVAGRVVFLCFLTHFHKTGKPKTLPVD